MLPPRGLRARPRRRTWTPGCPAPTRSWSRPCRPPRPGDSRPCAASLLAGLRPAVALAIRLRRPGQRGRRGRLLGARLARRAARRPGSRRSCGAQSLDRPSPGSCAGAGGPRTPTAGAVRGLPPGAGPGPGRARRGGPARPGGPVPVHRHDPAWRSAQGWPHERMHALWREVVARAPHHVGAHAAALPASGAPSGKGSPTS